MSRHELYYWIYLSEVKGVPLEFLCLFKSHHLDVESPWWILALCDSIVQVSDGVIGVCTSYFCGFLCQQVFDALVCLQCEDKDMLNMVWRWQIKHTQFNTLTYSIQPAFSWFQAQNWTNLFPPSVSAWPTQNFLFVTKVTKLVFFEHFNIHVSWWGSTLFAEKIKIITRKL